MQPDAKNASDQGIHFLDVKSLKKSFSSGADPNFPVVNVKSFTLDSNHQLAIYGKSGSGKSTFLNLIAGILRADSGSINLGNTDITTLSETDRDRTRAYNTGYVFQSFHLLQGCTALENVMVAMAVNGLANKKKARELLSMVDMSERENYLPSQLSIGQQQRVCIARALANNPKLILADEPTGSLDPENAFRCIELLKTLCMQNGSSLLVVSHDPNIIECFDSSINWEEINAADGGSNES